MKINLIKSKIILIKEIKKNLLDILPKKYNIELIFRGSENGFTAVAFRSKCEYQNPTLTIIKSEHQKIFGAFTDNSW